MSRSTRQSPYAFPAEVARYLAIKPADVGRMIRLDGLPATKLPKATRTVLRIYLPDLHRWLISRTQGTSHALGSYGEWLATFDASARIHRSDDGAETKHEKNAPTPTPSNGNAAEPPAKR